MCNFSYSKQIDSTIYTHLKPKIFERPAVNASDLMSSLNFKTLSTKFVQKIYWNYNENYGINNQIENGEWKQLKIFETIYDLDALTFFVSGSVISLDWAPKTGGNDDYLAVVSSTAENQNVSVVLNETSKAVVQIWQIKGLDNNK